MLHFVINKQMVKGMLSPKPLKVVSIFDLKKQLLLARSIIIKTNLIRSVRRKRGGFVLYRSRRPQCSFRWVDLSVCAVTGRRHRDAIHLLAVSTAV